MNAQEPVLHVMTAAVLSIDVGQPAGDVLRQFASYPVHHMPVVDGGKVVGMLSSADLIKLEAFLPRGGRRCDEYLDQHVKIRNLMRQPAITIGARDTIAEAATRMASGGIHALPVVDEHDNLIGIVTTTDIMHAALQATPGDGNPRATNAAAAGSTAAMWLQALEAVYHAASRYTSAGQDEQLHARLVQAIADAHRCAERADAVASAA